MEYQVQVYLLSEKFSKDYPTNTYPELMYKQGRPYTCLVIELYDDFFICVPFRSNIRHKNAYMFSNTVRSQKTRSGLDYSKMAIIRDPEYIDSSKTAIVDADEYAEMMKKLPVIVKKVSDYVDTYINHINGSAPLKTKEYSRKYQFSTLPYFHKILGL